MTSDCFASDPAWSPRGDQLAVVDSKDGTPAIWIVNADGSYAHRASPANVVAQEPAWSRSGRIAFAVNQYGDEGLWVVNADGTAASHITGFGRRPTWAPAGDQIAFSDPAHDAVMVMRPDGTNIEQIGLGQGPSFSPDGDRIAWTFTNDRAQAMIIVARPDGSDQRVVYATPPVEYPYSKGLSGDYLLTWSPDGTTLGFSQGGELYVVPVIGGQPERVTVNAALDTDPDWQPTVPSTGLTISRIAFPQRSCATKKSVATTSVTDAQGRPLSGVSIVLRGGKTPVRAVTAAAGEARLAVRADRRHRGRLALTVVASQAGRPTVTKRVSLPGCS